jgi:hypothetical protein
MVRVRVVVTAPVRVVSPVMESVVWLISVLVCTLEIVWLTVTEDRKDRVVSLVILAVVVVLVVTVWMNVVLVITAVASVADVVNRGPEHSGYAERKQLMKLGEAGCKVAWPTPYGRIPHSVVPALTVVLLIQNGGVNPDVAVCTWLLCMKLQISVHSPHRVFMVEV